MMEMGATSSSTLLHEEYDVVDFRKTRYCMKYKYRTMGDYMDFEPCTEKDLHNMIFLSRQDTPCFLEDEGKLYLSSSAQSIIDRDSVQCLGLCDGIYDIWLRNCKNVSYINIEVEGIGSVYTRTFDTPLNGDMQIRPYLCDKVMYNRDQSGLHVSFIPAAVYIHNKVTVSINADAKCTLTLSTVYLTMEQRKELFDKTVTFGIDTKAYRYTKANKWKLRRV